MQEVYLSVFLGGGKQKQKQKTTYRVVREASLGEEPNAAGASADLIINSGPILS